MKNVKLWEKIRSFQVRDEMDQYSFKKRLAVENNWSFQFAATVYDEYLKFIYLTCISESPVTPSDEIDQAWHLHMIYTQSYWNEMCRSILNQDIHHTPTRGGESENSKFHAYYNKTCTLYEIEFGYPPRQDVWPDPGKRFTDYLDFKRIDTASNIILKRSVIRNAVLIAISPLVLAACSLDELNTFEWISIGFFIVVVLLILYIGRNRRGARKDKGSGSSWWCSSCGSGCSSGGSGCCGSGGD